MTTLPTRLWAIGKRPSRIWAWTAVVERPSIPATWPTFKKRDVIRYCAAKAARAVSIRSDTSTAFDNEVDELGCGSESEMFGMHSSVKWGHPPLNADSKPFPS